MIFAGVSPVMLVLSTRAMNMARTPGSPNEDHEQKRIALLRALLPHLLVATPERPSLRDLARAAGVQPNTLRHYFGDRDGVVVAVLEQSRRDGAPWIAAVGSFAALEPRQALRTYLGWLVLGWTDGALGGLHGGGLAEALGSAAVGPAYVTAVLEPTLAALEDLLGAWVARGALPALDRRAAALALLAPALVVLLHQRQLGGAGCRPLDLEAWLDAHLAGWWGGWAGPAAQPPPP